jgi:O-acetylserine/cysteine efflux transporter
VSVRSEAAALDILPRDLALLIAINLAWGFNLIASKVGTAEFPPLLFTVLRFTILSLCLLPFLRWHAGQMANIWRAGLFLGGCSYALLFVGLKISADASTVAIASQLSVPFQTLLSVWLLGEIVHWRRRLGIALAFGGVVLIGFEPRVFDYWPGLMLVIASAFFGALGLIYVKRLHNVSAIQVQAWVSMLTWPLALVLTLLFETGQGEAMAAASTMAWLSLVYTIIGGSLFGHTLWYYLVSRYPVTKVAPLTLLSPLFSIAFGIALLQDHLTARMWLGGAITLAGVFIVMLRERKLVDTGT